MYDKTEKLAARRMTDEEHDFYITWYDAIHHSKM